jgi:uncharacterized membrane protein
MEAFGILIVVAVIVAPFALGIWLVVQANTARRRLDELARRLGSVEVELFQLKKGERPAPPPVAQPTTAAQPAPAAPPVTPSLAGALLEQRAVRIVPPPIAPTPPPVAATTPTAPPVLESKTVPPALVAPVLPPRPVVPKINWENFLGVKLFAWIGGLLLFLGVAFFIKYSFEHNLIKPPLRIALGYLTGLGLLIGGLRLARERYAVLVQALCGAAVLIFYGNTFAAHGMYHLLPQLGAFALMTLVTAVAFGLAVRLNAQTVAVLGILGGFLTPVLLSSGEDKAVGLFSYIALLDAGLLAVALRQRWNHLALLAWIGTAIMQAGWVSKFFAVEKINIAMTVFLGFAALFAGALAVAQRLNRADKWLQACAVLAPGAALLFASHLLLEPYPALIVRPGLLFGFIFAADLVLLAVVWLEKELRPVHLGAGGAAFLLLAIWTGKFLTLDLMNWALGLYLLFALLHSVYPVVLEKLRPGRHPLWWAHCFPVAALLLLLMPLLKFEQSPLLIWPVILVVDLLAIVLAAATASLLAVAAVLVLTLAITGCWILRVPAELASLPEPLLIIGGFAVFFVLASVWAARKVLPKLAAGPEQPAWAANLLGASPMAHLPAASALLPFLLLIMLTTRLALPNPSPVFGLALLLLVLLLGIVRLYGLNALCVVGLFATFLLELVWHERHFVHDFGFAPVALGWHLGFAALFLVFPFLFRERFRDQTAPWAAAALALPLHFTLIYSTVKGAWLAGKLGLVPAALAVPLFLALVVVLRWLPADAPKRNTLLALFGGAALFFVTLIFPIQFSKQWLTVAWALEGAALLWLFHRVPHPGLRIVGGALLVVAFVRLGLNPSVFDYSPRSATRILNWYLYTYGLVTLALFIGARLLAPPRDRVGGFNLRALLAVLGTVLAFILVNIEIADFFSTGTRIEFSFSGNFARDMTYSLAWAVFAGIVLGIGVRQKLAPARYAGLGLLVVTLLKLFLHDLWQLRGLYRIGSLIGLAIALMLVSFIYQKFLTTGGKKDEPPPTPPTPPVL